MEEMELAARLEALGGRLYIVGGWIRDHFRGVEAGDKDYVVTGIAETTFFQEFPAARKVGNSFPVYLLWIAGKKCEIAFARREEKAGSGYRGFSVTYDPAVQIEEDLQRRDTTMNSIAYCLQSRSFIDPYHGVRDIKAGCIRATSRHFLDDPVRALRAARQAAQTGFAIDGDTIALMRACRGELQAEPAERLLAELGKALNSPRPSVFFRSLHRAQLLDVTYPQIFALIGQSQPQAAHPEGDAFEHSMIVLDDVARQTERAEVRFAALAHDLGKGLTPPEELPHHYGHEQRGIEALRLFNRRMTLPKLWRSCAQLMIVEHMRAPMLRKVGKIVDLLIRIDKSPLDFAGFNAVIAADHGSLPEFLRHYSDCLTAIRQARGGAIPERLMGREIGQWIRQQQILACRKLLNEV